MLKIELPHEFEKFKSAAFLRHKAWENAPWSYPSFVEGFEARLECVKKFDSKSSFGRLFESGARWGVCHLGYSKDCKEWLNNPLHKARYNLYVWVINFEKL